MAKVRKRTGKLKVRNYINDYSARNDFSFFFPTQSIEKYWISDRMQNGNYRQISVGRHEKPTIILN